jgi:hypothetical protein
MTSRRSKLHAAADPHWDLGLLMWFRFGSRGSQSKAEVSGFVTIVLVRRQGRHEHGRPPGVAARLTLCRGVRFSRGPSSGSPLLG